MTRDSRKCQVSLYSGELKKLAILGPGLMLSLSIFTVRAKGSASPSEPSNAALKELLKRLSYSFCNFSYQFSAKVSRYMFLCLNAWFNLSLRQT